MAGDEVRVLVVIDSLDQGGAEQSLQALLPTLRPRGVDVELALLRSADREAEASLRRRGVGVRILGTGSSVPATARALRALVRQQRVDVLHATLFTPIVAASLATIGTGVPVLASMVNTPPARRSNVDASGRPWKVEAAVTVEALACRHLVTRLHAVTPGVRRATEARYGVDPSRIVVAERGRDGDRFHPPTPEARAAIRAELGLGADDEVVVALGRHEPSKGFGDLVDAVARLAPDRPRLRVVLAGREGTQTAALRSRIGAAGLTDRIDLLGRRPDPERVLAAGDLFVLSSLREGTSGASIEAMATGLPVVATRLAGLEGILVDDRQALLVPAGDPPALARAVARVLDDPDLARRLGTAGRATFAARFTLDASSAAFAEMYRSVAGAGR